ncbi:MAG: type I CRISPR-associated protein Cas7 [Candidatus ainarchaeum sp.]|nr:type I CRISPR-associated protein Cas7 [Candidatus ainarchaeum sp.]
MDKNEIIDKSYNGLLVVKARNGNFNAGFDGNPRTLPDGRIFATDKALKYCIREYLATFKDKPVFVRRERIVKENKKDHILSYLTLEENFSKKTGLQEVPIGKDHELLQKLKEFIDIRLFGIVFSVNSNISLTGPVQISYGLNKLNDSNIYCSQILSPYKNPNEKSKDSAQTTIGNETRADEVYYVYNISVNSNNANLTDFSKNDLVVLKEALLNSVDPITSCTKFGCESICLIWLNNKNNIILNNLDEFLEIIKLNGKVELNIKNLKEYLKNYGFNGLEKEEYSLKTDFSKESENKIQIIYKKGKIDVVE